MKRFSEIWLLFEYLNLTHLRALSKYFSLVLCWRLTSSSKVMLPASKWRAFRAYLSSCLLLGRTSVDCRHGLFCCDFKRPGAWKVERHRIYLWNPSMTYKSHLRAQRLEKHRIFDNVRPNLHCHSKHVLPDSPHEMFQIAMGSISRLLGK